MSNSSRRGLARVVSPSTLIDVAMLVVSPMTSAPLPVTSGFSPVLSRALIVICNPIAGSPSPKTSPREKFRPLWLPLPTNREKWLLFHTLAAGADAVRPSRLRLVNTRVTTLFRLLHNVTVTLLAAPRRLLGQLSHQKIERFDRGQH